MSVSPTTRLPTRAAADPLRLDAIFRESSGPPISQARLRWRRLLEKFPELDAIAGADLLRVDYPHPPAEPKLIVRLIGTLTSYPALRAVLLAALAADLVPLVQQLVEKVVKRRRRKGGNLE
jgi:hypothetical protein